MIKNNEMTKNKQISPDIIVENLSLQVPGKQLLKDTTLRIISGHKYGLIGHNGLGKTTLLKAIANREVKIPSEIDLLYVEQEVNASDTKTVFQTVIEANEERNNLIHQYNEILKKIEIEIESDQDESDELIESYNDILTKLQQAGVDKDESHVRQMLYGLGFDKKHQDMTTNEFSGGWRMRISIARALYMKPSLLLLDEPTNHLDLNGTIFLTNYLAERYNKTVVVVSHDRNFLDEVCTDIIHLNNEKLNCYKGNYTKFLKGVELQEITVEKEWKKVLQKVKEMRHKSIPKIEVDEFLKKNKDKEPKKPYQPKISFTNPPVLNASLISLQDASFFYDPLKPIFSNLSIDINLDTKIVIVGKNGAGKSTLMKVLANQLKPTNGYQIVDNRTRIGYFHQHSHEVLPNDLTPVEYIMSINKSIDQQKIRSMLGGIGLEGKMHVKPINLLSGGQKARVAFVGVQATNPNLLLLDEPTNHLDIATCDALIDALNRYEGAMITITHNLNLIDGIECKILEVKDGKCQFTDIDTYYDQVIDEIYLKN